MTDISVSSGVPAKKAISPILLALIAVSIATAGDFARGFAALSSTLDNDSQMRLVEVRDLLAGQGWFDLHQYRMGGPEGSPMHWSRLIDAPIAAIIWLGSALTGSQAISESIALVLWPALTMATALYLLLWVAKRYGGDEALLPTAVIGAIALYVTGIFGPGSLDHHNVQLVLTVAILAFLLDSADRPHSACLAGIAAALSLAVGMETAPYVAIAGVTVSIWFLLRGDAANIAFSYGLGFAGASLAALALAKPWTEWFAAECDAFSAFQFAVAFAGGVGIACIASVRALRGSLSARLAALTALGIFIASMVVWAFPQCLAAPYADLDPRLRAYWMQSITETQSILSVVRGMPILAATVYPTVIVAIFWLITRVIRRAIRVEDALVAAFLVSAAAMSFYQLRGANFAMAFAIVPLAAMIADQRQRLERLPSLKNNMRVVGAWLISVNLVWMLVATLVLNQLSPGQSARERQSIGNATSCSKVDDFAQLASMAPARLASITNLASPILRLTPHHSLAGPYHRNITGNLAALNLLAAKSDAGQAIAKDSGVELIVVCRGNPESGNYAHGTLQSELNAGRAPTWLQLVPETSGQNLEVYRVVTN